MLKNILTFTLKVMNVFFMNHRGHRDHREKNLLSGITLRSEIHVDN